MSTDVIPSKKAFSIKAEGFANFLIVLFVGAAAGAASFTHVHDWTLDNSPAGTGDWFGWANAVISELVPIACLLTMRQRKRTGGSITYPLFLLIAAAGFSLTAQLAVSKPGASGAVVAALPAVAFMALVKLVLSPQKIAAPAPTRPPVNLPPAPLVYDHHPAQPARPAVPATEPAPPAPTQPVTPVATTPITVEVVDEPALPEQLVSTARRTAEHFASQIGRPITAGELAATMNIDNNTARRLLPRLDIPAAPSLNGHAVVGGLSR